MNITDLVIENVMRIKTFSHSPTPGMNVIGGRNEQGKSPILNCIDALFGKRAMSDNMLREGAKKGSITLVTDGDTPLRVVMEFRKGKPEPFKFEVFNADGSDIDGTPRAILDKLLPKMGFDGDAFEKMSQKKRVEVLKNLDPTLDFTELNREYDEVYSKRTKINTLKDNAMGAVATLVEQMGGPKSHKYKPPEPVVVSELAATLTQMEEQIRENGEIARACDDAEQELQGASDNLERAKERVVEAEGWLATRKDAEKLTRKALEATNIPDINGVREQLSNAEEINEEARMWGELRGLQKEAGDLAAESEEMTERLDAIKEEKVEAVENSTLGIKGLALDDDTVMYEGLPFDVASDQKRIEISTKIGQLQNPELNIVLIRGGSLYDDEALARLDKDCEKDGRQVFVERVGKGAECSVIIEDGMIEEATEESKQ